MSVFGFIANRKAEHSVKTLCRVLGVSRSGFHAWERRAPSDSLVFGERCRTAGVQISMGSKGDAYDNAVAESFFSSLEKHLLPPLGHDPPRRAHGSVRLHRNVLQHDQAPLDIRLPVADRVRNHQTPRKESSGLTVTCPPKRSTPPLPHSHGSLLVDSSRNLPRALLHTPDSAYGELNLSWRHQEPVSKSARPHAEGHVGRSSQRGPLLTNLGVCPRARPEPAPSHRSCRARTR